MNKNSSINGRTTSSLAKSTGGHAHSARITEPLHRIFPFSTPLLGRRGLHMPTRRLDNDSLELTGRTSKNSSHDGTLKRSWSVNAKTRQNVGVSRTHVRSDATLKALCLLPSSSTGAVARYVSESKFFFIKMYIIWAGMHYNAIKQELWATYRQSALSTGCRVSDIILTLNDWQCYLCVVHFQISASFVILEFLLGLVG